MDATTFMTIAVRYTSDPRPKICLSLFRRRGWSSRAASCQAELPLVRNCFQALYFMLRQFSSSSPWTLPGPPGATAADPSLLIATSGMEGCERVDAVSPAPDAALAKVVSTRSARKRLVRSCDMVIYPTPKVAWKYVWSPADSRGPSLSAAFARKENVTMLLTVT